MPQPITFNGSTYQVPNYNDTGWAQGAGNMTAYLVAVSQGTLQTTGGSFTLSADVNFGSTYGLLASYFKTVTASPATLGVLRLALSDEICWGPSNLALTVSSSRLQFNGQQLLIASDLPGDVTQNREVYTAGIASANYTGSLTVIAMVGTYTTNGKNLNVYINGLLQDVGVSLDYTETSSNSLTMNSPLNPGDRISLRWTTF